ncbi:MAG: aminopeptidase P family protein [Phycisphaerales bacterium]|nr:MAG: aminopeptidase P family protein [Phycisphaerales bacterium]
MNKNKIAKRIMAIRRKLHGTKADCLIVTEPANVTYTTGFMGEDSWAVITKRAVYLLTDSRYTEQAQNECPSCRIVARPAAMTDAVGNLLKKLKSVHVVAVEESTSVAAFTRLKKTLKMRLRAVSGTVEAGRSTKDSSEIAAIRAAGSIAAQALKRTLRRLKPGTSENELAGMINLEIRRLGAVNSFDIIVAFGPNASRPHHQPSERRLKQKDTVLIDFGARYKGYCSDITRCFAIGRPSTLYEKARKVVQQAQAAAIAAVRAGIGADSVDAAAREMIRKNDLPVYGHGTGHGLGLEIHEQPFLKAENHEKLKAGQVITIEPGIYIPGKLGVRQEDDILVTETGCEILTGKGPLLRLPGG